MSIFGMAFFVWPGPSAPFLSPNDPSPVRSPPGSTTGRPRQKTDQAGCSAKRAMASFKAGLGRMATAARWGSGK